MKTLSEQLLQMKEEFDSVGVKLNGLTWQRIERHMSEYAREVAKGALRNAAEKVDFKNFLTAESKYDLEINKDSITNESNIPKLL